MKHFYPCLLILSTIIVSSSPKTYTDIGLTPIVNVKAEHNSCLKCNSDSFLRGLIDSTVHVPNTVTCNGFTFKQLPYYYRFLISNITEIVVINELNIFAAFINGNVLTISNGYITNGTCAEDYIYSVRFSLADDQNGCNEVYGLNQQRIVYDSFQILGRCDSLCFGSGETNFKPAINNYGLVDQPQQLN